MRTVRTSAGNQGFTLGERVIVIAVIAILAGIALLRLRGMIDAGKTARAAADLRALQAAVESYYIHNSRTYPADGIATWQSALTASTTKPKLISSALSDPFSPTAGTEYQYDQSSNGLYYVIWSVGPDNTSDISSIETDGSISRADDDIYVSNGTSDTGGF
jgi:prepilin-type N-terminal cleavage/methylation domain-containing protein